MPLKDEAQRRDYHARYMREVWYPKNRDKHIGYVRELKQKLLVYIYEYKKKNTCADCGLKGDPYPEILEFDHIKSKNFEISSFSRKILSMKALQAEISKSELVCANCHRIRTVKRQRMKSKLLKKR